MVCAMQSVVLFPCCDAVRAAGDGQHVRMSPLLVLSTQIGGATHSAVLCCAVLSHALL